MTHSQQSTDTTKDENHPEVSLRKQSMLATVRENVIGSHHDTLLRTPFGQKPFVYCDSTASGKGLKSIEEYLATTVMPHYANTHTM